MTQQQQEPTPQPEGSENGAGEPVEGEEKQFPESYVKELRQEAAENRKKAEQVDSLRAALQTAYLREGTSGVLHDPEALVWSDDFNDEETGLPDVVKIKEAAEALAEERPWLSRARGDAGQGFRGEQSDSVDLADLLRAGA